MYRHIHVHVHGQKSSYQTFLHVVTCTQQSMHLYHFTYMYIPIHSATITSTWAEHYRNVNWDILLQFLHEQIKVFQWSEGELRTYTATSTLHYPLYVQLRIPAPFIPWNFTRYMYTWMYMCTSTCTIRLSPNDQSSKHMCNEGYSSRSVCVHLLSPQWLQYLLHFNTQTKVYTAFLDILICKKCFNLHVMALFFENNLCQQWSNH